MKRFFTLLLVIPLCLVNPPSVSGGPITILFDTTHPDPAFGGSDNTLEGVYSNLRDIALARGDAISELTGSPGAITPSALAGVNLFISFDPGPTNGGGNSFLPGEITALHNFIASGGFVFVAGDNTTFDLGAATNITAPYGLQFYNGVQGPVSLVPVASDILTAGLDPGTSINFEGSGTPITVSGTGTKILAVDSNNPTVVTYAYGDNGNVLIFSNAHLFSNPSLFADGSGEKHQLLQDMFAHFEALESAAAVPEPSALITALAGLSAFAWMCRRHCGRVIFAPRSTTYLRWPNFSSAH